MLLNCFHIDPKDAFDNVFICSMGQYPKDNCFSSLSAFWIVKNSKVYLKLFVTRQIGDTQIKRFRRIVLLLKGGNRESELNSCLRLYTAPFSDK